MEEEQSLGSEKQEPTDEQGATEQAGGTTTVRSYECNFCKRGFTNAQALGGHMNIHRKDKAKLKQSSSDPSTIQPQHFPPSSPKLLPPPNMFQNQPEKWTFPTSPKKHHTHIHIVNKSESDHQVNNQLLLLGDQNSLPPPPPPPPAEGLPELDLELRLGHNTDKPPSSDQKGTRKFF